MNGCPQYAPLIGSREGELPDKEKEALAVHLSACPACRTRLADQRALESLLGDALLQEASRRDFSPFVDEVMERIETSRAAAQRPAPFLPVGNDRPSATEEIPRPWWQRWRFVLRYAFVPTLAAIGLIVYLQIQSPGFDAADVIVTSEDQVPMVLQTDDGPLVVFGDEDPENS